MGVSASLGFSLGIWSDLLAGHWSAPDPALGDREPAGAASTLLLMAAAPTGPAPEERASRSVTLRVYFQAWGPVLPALPDLFTAYLPS